MIDLIRDWNRAVDDLDVIGPNGFDGMKIEKFLRKQQSIVEREISKWKQQ